MFKKEKEKNKIKEMKFGGLKIFFVVEVF